MKCYEPSHSCSIHGASIREPVSRALGMGNDPLIILQKQYLSCLLYRRFYRHSCSGMSLGEPSLEGPLSIQIGQRNGNPHLEALLPSLGSGIPALLVTVTPAPEAWPEMQSFETGLGEESASGSHGASRR